MSRKIALAIQFWDGDKEAAMRNLKRIADIEPIFRSDVEVLLVCRFDSSHDEKAVEYASKKFKVTTYVSPRRGKGWPYGCNDLWSETMSESYRRVRSGEWSDVKALYTMEADCIPISRTWLNRLHKEWDATEREGKWMTGCVASWNGNPDDLHLNGNGLFHPHLQHFIPKIVGGPANLAWDVYFAKDFRPHWRAAGFMANLYNARNVSPDDLQSLADSGTEVVHGVKDLSVEKWADARLGP